MVRIRFGSVIMSGVGCSLAGAGGLGGTAATPNLAPNDSQLNVSANAVLSLLSNGTYTSTGEAGGNFCNPTSIAAGLEARLTLNAGTSPTGAAMGTWLNLGTTRTWTVTSALAGTVTSTCTLEIRDLSTQTILDSSSVAFSASSFTFP